MQTILYQKYRIKYAIEGKGEPILFLHGWPTNSLLWKSQVESLKKQFRTICIDWLGFGQSDKPTNHQYTFTNQKNILDVLLAHVLKPDEKVNIVAHDIGGPPAILWASENQHRVKRLILLNTVLFPFSTPLDKLSHYFFKVPLINDILMSSFGLKTLMNVLSKSGNAGIGMRIKEILAANESMSKAMRIKAILEPVNTGLKNEILTLSKEFEDLSVNRYLIIAKKDPLCFQHIEKLRINNPDVPAYPIKNCGHYIPIDQAEKLTEVLHKILVDYD